MTILNVPIQLDGNATEAFQVQSVQLSTQLAAHVAVIEDGRLMDPSTWVVRHIRTGVEIEHFQHFGPAPEIVDLTALRRFAGWMERVVDLDSGDAAEVFERLVASGINVAEVVGYYTDKINDWCEPQACRRCGADHAHPVDNVCFNCRQDAVLHRSNPTDSGAAPAAPAIETWDIDKTRQDRSLTMHATSPSPNEFGLGIVLPYGCALLLLVAAGVIGSLLASQLRFYIRTGERRRPGERVLQGSVGIGFALWFVTQTALHDVAPAPGWFQRPMETGWDWALGAGYSLYLITGALVLLVGVVAAFAGIAWGVGAMLRDKDSRDRWFQAGREFGAGLRHQLRRRLRRAADAN